MAEGEAAAVGVPSEPLPACVGELTVEQKASQLLMVLASAPGQAAAAVSERKVGGYSLIGTQAADVGDQNAMIAAQSPFPLLVSSDEEGGLVQRLRDVLGPLPSAATVASTMSVGEATVAFQNYAARMRQLGFNMNFGPVLDVGTGSGLGERAFGTDVETVTNFGLGVMTATSQAGVIPVVKHWPGIGSGGADPHRSATPVPALSVLETLDLVPFDRAIALGAPAIMISHATVPELTEGLPASLSSAAVTGVLRGEKGYTGLVVTDSLGMTAVTMHVPEPQAAVMSIGAGSDIALLSGIAVVEESYNAMVAAITDGRLPAAQIDQSVGRVLRAKGITGSCPVAG